MSEHQTPEGNKDPQKDPKGSKGEPLQPLGQKGASVPPPPFNLDAGEDEQKEHLRTAGHNSRVDSSPEKRVQLVTALHEVLRRRRESEELIAEIVGMDSTSFREVEAAYNAQFTFNSEGSQLIHDLHQRFWNDPDVLFRIFRGLAPVFGTEQSSGAGKSPEPSFEEKAERYQRLALQMTPEGGQDTVLVGNSVNLRMVYDADYPPFADEWPWVQRAMIRHEDADFPEYSPSFVGPNGFDYSFEKPGTYEVLFLIGFDPNGEEMMPYTLTLRVKSLQARNEESLFLVGEKNKEKGVAASSLPAGSGILPGRELKIHAVHSQRESGKITLLDMWMGPSGEGKELVLYDGSPDALQKRYRGESTELLLDLFRRDNAYSKGLLTLMIPPNEGGITTGKYEFETDADSTSDNFLGLD